MAFDFEISLADIDGVKEIKPSQFSDYRGQLWSGLSKELEDTLDVGSFRHQKFATNKKNVLRGIHGDFETFKLVTCLFGEIQQVVVDMRPDSKTYKKWVSWEINGEKPCLILIPPGVGNSFKTLSEISLYSYSLAYNGTYNDYDKQFTVKYDDPSINIAWLGQTPVLSERDRS